MMIARCFVTILLPLFCYAQQPQLISNPCEPLVYYSGLTSTEKPLRTEVANLLRNTQWPDGVSEDRTGDDLNVWNALTDLEAYMAGADAMSDSVTLFYNQSLAIGDSGWSREHLWPKSRGLGVGGMDTNDLHNTYPATTSLNLLRGNKLFADCEDAAISIQRQGSLCAVPDGAPSDTRVSDTTFLPTASIRGDIARALLYMATRYTGGPTGETNLQLTDCPEDNTSDMGYLSQLLEWHKNDPVSVEEIRRNDRVCTMWQGNRNPFVDNPDWAEHFFGTPQQAPYDCSAENEVTQFPVLTPAVQQDEEGSVSGTSFTILFDMCTEDVYYQSMGNTSLLTRAHLEELSQERHRRAVRYTDSDEGDDDVWKALTVLWPGEEANTVRLIYRQVDVAADLAGETSGWNREHLWPKSLGVDSQGADFTDLHHLAPSDWNVNTARSNKFFADCNVGVLEEGDECREPANEEAAADTAASKMTFLPPEAVRGDIARALFYMDIRYSGNKENELNLQLTDCPESDDDASMGYLSQLLLWHEQDPVSNEERDRNDAICGRWQGNRNPFIDHPELVSRIFGTPQDQPYNCAVGDSTNESGESMNESGGTDEDETGVAFKPSANCAQPGAIMPIGFNAKNPDTLALVVLEDVPGGMTMFATDNAWTGSDWVDSEGVIRFQFPASGMSAGTVFGYDGSISDDSESQFPTWNWEKVKGSFALSASGGDNVILFCNPQEESDMSPISGISFGGTEWVWLGGDTSTSALPVGLEDASVTLIQADNYKYVGRTRGTSSELRDAIRDRTNWQSSNAARFMDLASMEFTVEGGGGTGGTSPGGEGTSGVSRPVFGMLALIVCALVFY